MFFAELGAEVIKVENAKTDGDMTRHWKLAKEDKSASVSAYFSSINFQKTYLRKDLSDASDLSEVKSIIATADIVISNFSTGAAQRFGLDANSLTAAYPQLIHAHLSGFVSQPDKVAFDMVLQAETGFLSMSGTARGEVTKMPVALIDILAAHQLKEGILVALLHRAETGKGGSIRSSLEESALASLANQASNYLMTGHVAQKMGTLHPNIAPYGEVVMSRDQVEFVLAVGTEGQFTKMAKWLNIPLLAEERFSSNQLRLDSREELHTLLKRAFATLDSQEIEERSKEEKIPIGRIKSLDEVLETETAKGMRRQETIEGQDTLRMSSLAFHFSPTL